MRQRFPGPAEREALYTEAMRILIALALFVSLSITAACGKGTPSIPAPDPKPEPPLVIFGQDGGTSDM